MKDVIISIIGTQAVPGDEDSSIELVTDGKYSHSDGNTSFSYMESELTGLEGTKTTFTLDALGNIAMQREGSLNSRMVFEKGKRHTFLYDTPFGAATMSVNTSRISAEMGECGGNVEIDYTVDFENAVVGKNRFKIFVRERNRGDTNCQI